MKPLLFVWPYNLVFWPIFIWAFLPEFGIIRRATPAVRRETSQDAGSCRVIVIGMSLAGLVAWPIAMMHWFQFPPWMALPAFAAGIALLVSGSLLRRHCFRMLGTSFTGDVRAREDQQIVTKGAYALLRHPSYSAGVLMNLGIGLSLGSWASALVLLVSSFAVYWYRMTVEERALLTTLGEPYREFMRTRKRLVPYVY